MLGLFKRKMNRQEVLGVEFYPNGVACALYKPLARRQTFAVSCKFLSSETESPASLLKSFIQQNNLQGVSTVFLMPGEKYSLLQTSSPPMEKDELRAAVKWRIRDLINYPAEQAVVDVFELPESGQRSTDRLLYAVSAKKSDVAEYVETLRDGAGLALKAMDIPELAICNIVHRLPDNAAGVAVLLLSESGGLLVLVKDSEMYLARRLELGLNEIQQANESGSMQTLTDGVLLELQRSLDYFEANFVQSLPSKLLVYPSTEAVKNMLPLLNEQLSITVEALGLEQISDIELQADADAQHNCLLAAAAALRQDFEEAA